MCLRPGFTGTREKLTSAQLAALREFLLALRPYRGDHGDCVGADTAFHMILRELEVPVTVHPPTNKEFRSFVWTSADLGDVVCVEKNYLERNEDIVRDTDFLIGAANRVAVRVIRRVRPTKAGLAEVAALLVAHKKEIDELMKECPEVHSELDGK